MPIKNLHHVNLRTANLERLRAYYTEVLDMTDGPRAAVSTTGAWLYLGDVACVHLVGVPEMPAPEGEMQLEHFAFSAEGLADFLELLKRRGEDYRLRVISSVDLIQVNINDPDGNHIHVDFPLAEAATVPDEPALAAV